MALITGNCPVCQEAIRPADNQAQFNRNKGLHLRTAHGQKGGKTYIPVSQRPGHPKYAGPAVAAEDQERREAEKAARREAYRRKKNQNHEAVPVSLKECPCCGARFYVAKGSV